MWGRCGEEGESGSELMARLYDGKQGGGSGGCVCGGGEGGGVTGHWLVTPSSLRLPPPPSPAVMAGTHRSAGRRRSPRQPPCSYAGRRR